MKLKITATHRPGHDGVLLPPPNFQHLPEGETVTVEYDSVAALEGIRNWVDVEEILPEPEPVKKSTRGKANGNTADN